MEAAEEVRPVVIFGVNAMRCTCSTVNGRGEEDFPGRLSRDFRLGDLRRFSHFIFVRSQMSEGRASSDASMSFIPCRRTPVKTPHTVAPSSLLAPILS